MSLGNQKNVITRFAPSPTGFLHVGGVRTALYAWLFARKQGGTFILRIDDTDKEREVPGSIEHIVESLSWLGITWDNAEIYKQSEHLDLYRRYGEELLAAGKAYVDPYTEEELDSLRKRAEEEKRAFLFREHRPPSRGRSPLRRGEGPSAAAEATGWYGKRPLRFRVPELKRYAWSDVVRGALSAGEEALDDFILIKSDGYPTYNFSHIVDDIEMGVTHVIRGEEFISSTPRFLSLYEALGKKPPTYAILPPILGPDGKKKLSKRDGAKDILDYRKEGYLPDAVVNFLALLGWHPEDEREVMTREELTAAFSLERVQKGGATFDETKLRWFNHEHLKRLSDAEFLSRCTAFLKERGSPVPVYLGKIAGLLHERFETLSAAASALELGEFSFMEEIPPYDEHLLTKGAKAEIPVIADHLKQTQALLAGIEGDAFSASRIKDVLFPYATEKGRSAVLWPLRVALSGKERSPDPFTLAELLGKEETTKRIEVGIAKIG